MNEIDPFDKEGSMAGGEVGYKFTEVPPACEMCGTRARKRENIKGFWLCSRCSVSSQGSSESETK